MANPPDPKKRAKQVRDAIDEAVDIGAAGAIGAAAGALAGVRIGGGKGAAAGALAGGLGAMAGRMVAGGGAEEAEAEADVIERARQLRKKNPRLTGPEAIRKARGRSGGR
jgi:uncharacterized protein YcfJ